MKIILIFISLVALASGAEQCLNIRLQEEFNAANYMGVWHEQLRSKNIPFQKADCTTAKYTLNGDGSVVVVNSEYCSKADKFNTVIGTAWFKGPWGQVKFRSWAPAGDYRVVATDYKNYAIVYSCHYIWFLKSEYYWILTRERIAPIELINKALAVLQQRSPGVNPEILRRTVQGGNCKYLNRSPSVEAY